MHRKFHFEYNKEARDFILFETQNNMTRVVTHWPKVGYSREKALNRADRYVGAEVRRADAKTEFTYTQDIPKI